MQTAAADPLSPKISRPAERLVMVDAWRFAAAAVRYVVLTS